MNKKLKEIPGSIYLRYRNRKLYDVKQNKYVSNFEIIWNIKNEVEFKVFQHPTNQDVTDIVKASALATLIVKDQSYLAGLDIKRFLGGYNVLRLKEIFKEKKSYPEITLPVGSESIT